MYKEKYKTVYGCINPKEKYKIIQVTTDMDEPGREITFDKLTCPRADIKGTIRLLSEGFLCRCRISCESYNRHIEDTIHGPREVSGCCEDPQLDKWVEYTFLNKARKSAKKVFK
jgi:hypothetical protein